MSDVVADFEAWWWRWWCSGWLMVAAAYKAEPDLDDYRFRMWCRSWNWIGRVACRGGH